MGKPPYFHADNHKVTEKWLSHGVRIEQGTQNSNPLEIELFAAWERLSQKHRIFDFELLHAEMDAQSGKERSPHSLSRNITTLLSKLSAAGVVWRDRASTLGPGRGRSFVYSLRSPAELARNWAGRQDTSQDNPQLLSRAQRRKPAKPSAAAEQTYLHLRALGWFNIDQPLTEAGQNQPNDAWTLHLISQLIERCARSSSQAQIETIQSHIHINGQMIEVDAGRVRHHWENSVEYGLVTAGDSQLILAIITMAMQGIAHDLRAGIRPPRNRVSFDLMELSEMLNPGGGKVGYLAFQKGIARIINTEYRLTPMGESAGTRVRFRLIESVTEGASHDQGIYIDDEKVDWSPRKADMRYFSFSLNHHIWNGLLQGQGWLVHPELLYERSGLIHRVYHHLRTHATVDKAYEVSSDTLAKWLIPGGSGSNPTRSRQHFKKDLLEQLQKRAQRSQPMFSLLENQMPDHSLEFRLFDLDITLTRGTEAKPSSFYLSAKQSEETLALLRQQYGKMREMIGLGQPEGEGITQEIESP